MLAFLLSALATGFVVVVFLPFIKSWVDKLPGAGGLTSNKFVQLLIVGLIVLAGLGLFSWLARKVKL